MALEELQNGRYRRIRLLGSGGMGEVHLMEDTRINRQVAIKVLRSEGAVYSDKEKSKDAERLFQREAKAIAALEHPNILPLYDFGEEIIDGMTMTFMVMPFCTDGSLADWLKQRNEGGLLAPQIIAHFVEQAAEGLQCAHDQQVMHLDVKPSNFLLRVHKRNPHHPTLLLADFGIARSFTTISSSSRTIRGTPTSMAPEQWSAEPVLATDQYALAVMAYEMLVGRPPFIGSMEQLMYRHFSVQPDPPSKYNPHMTPAMDAVLIRALAKKPEERFPSIIAFASAFTQAAQEMGNSPLSGGLSAELYATQIESSSELSQMMTVVENDENGETVSPQKQAEKALETPEHSAPVTPSEALVLPSTDEQITETPAPLAAKIPEPVGPLVLASTDEQQIRETPAQPVAKTARPASSVIAARVQEPVTPAAGHDLPTLSVTLPKVGANEQSERPRRSSIQLIVSLSIIAVLIILLFAGTIFYFNNRQAGTAQTGASSTATTATATVAPTPTVAPTATPTIAPGKYIADSYQGSMTDQNTNASQSIIVYLTQKQGSGALKGSVTFKNSGEVDPLTGQVDTQGNFSFTVTLSGGKTPLYLFGQTQSQSDGVYLHGNYCNSSDSSCLALTGYFTAGPGY